MFLANGRQVETSRENYVQYTAVREKHYFQFDDLHKLKLSYLTSNNSVSNVKIDYYEVVYEYQQAFEQ